MILFIINVLLAVIWAAVTGEVTTQGVFTGFVLGYGILWLVRPVFDDDRYLAKFPKLMALVSLYVVDLLMANFRLALDVLTPRHRMKPAIVAVPLRARTGLEITLLSNLISMTPGSLAIALSPDRRTLYVHVVYCDDPGEVRRQIKDHLEKRLLEVLR